MWISRYFVYFVIFSFMGWVYESAFCTIKGKKWENRGFLYGPVCPIYGVGAAAITAIAEVLQVKAGVSFTWWQVFLVAFFGSIVLEYTTSWALEKLFHAYWWDYSGIPFNIHGRVCLPASVGFGIAGILVVYVVGPFTQKMTSFLPPIVMEALSLLFMAVVAADVTLTVSALTNFERNVIAMEEALNRHMEQFVNNLQEKKQAASTLMAEERVRFAREKAEQTIASIGETYRMALARVKGFKNPRVDRQGLEYILERFRKREPKQK